jgi:serine protease Do/serine protease DegQ
MDKTPVRGASDVRNKIGLLRVGDEIELTVLRDGRTVAVRAMLAAPAAQTLLHGSSVSPLLDGAEFGAAGPAAPGEGVEIVSVRVGSNAWEAGLRQGDIITSVNQRAVADLDEFAAEVKASPKRLLFNLIRDGSAMFLVVQ